MTANEKIKKQYNGIEIPEGWHFEFPKTGEVVVPPYLIPKDKGGYAPTVINIDVGRQLFVDDFLIEETDLTRTYYAAKKSKDNPILQAEKPWEFIGCGGTPATSGGFWYDQKEKKYKLWYEAGFNMRLAYAESEDGIHWERPVLQEDGSNILLPDVPTDSYSIWIDDNAPAEERYKMMIRCPNIPPCGRYKADLFLSADGIHWRLIGQTGMMGDRSTFFYNPFTKKWCFSIRSDGHMLWRGKDVWTRWRQYHEADDFYEAGQWEFEKTPLWQAPDNDDEIETSLCDHPPQVYNSDSIAYESILLGFYQMWLGPENDIIEVTKLPKITEIQMGYSRDGFYFERPWRHPFIEATREDGSWDYGYLQSPTGGVIVFDDELRIYYSGFSGVMKKPSGEENRLAYFGGAIGYATLRRDGFASMDGTETLFTKPLTLTKDVKYMFVNADASAGALRAELVDADGKILAGCSLANCEAIRENGCKMRISWRGVENLSFLKDSVFQVKFYMGNSKLYSFWFSPDEEGTSGGALGAGYIPKKCGNDQ